jgi:hypothetical protein
LFWKWGHLAKLGPVEQSPAARPGKRGPLPTLARVIPPGGYRRDKACASLSGTVQGAKAGAFLVPHEGCELLLETADCAGCIGHCSGHEAGAFEGEAGGAAEPCKCTVVTLTFGRS